LEGVIDLIFEKVCKLDAKPVPFSTGAQESDVGGGEGVIYAQILHQYIHKNLKGHK